jgi:hypothetical protein
MALMEWVDVVNATGIKAGRLDMGTVYLLAGKVIHDPVVVERKRKCAVNGVIPTGSSAEVVRAMTESEREQLRRRIQA